MITPCKPFNPVVDRFPYVPEQAVDLGMCLKTGQIPVTAAPERIGYNGIENPGNILGVRPADVFDAMQMESGVVSAGKKKEEPVVVPDPAPQTPAE